MRDWAIGGVYGNWVQVTDGRHKYARAPVDANMPLSMWSNRWSTMPIGGGLAEFRTFPNPDRRAVLDFMPGSDVPVIRQPFAAGDPLPFWAGGARNVGRHHLYDLCVDPDEEATALTPSRIEAELRELMLPTDPHDGKPVIIRTLDLGADKQYEVITKLTVNSKTKDKGENLFMMELEYAGVFFIDGVPEEQMHPYLLIECPRITFPFVRRIVSDVTRDGGFPPLNLETIDFLALYRNELARRMQAKQAEEKPADA